MEINLYKKTDWNCKFISSNSEKKLIWILNHIIFVRKKLAGIVSQNIWLEISF